MIAAFSQVVLTLLPFIALIGLGGYLQYLMRLQKGVTPDWKTLDWICYWVLNPALLFTSAAKKPLTFDLVIENGFWVWLIMITGLIIAVLIRPWMKLPAVEFTSRWQTAWRFNSVVGLAATSLISPDALQVMAIFIGASVPLANLLAVTALVMASGQRERNWFKNCLLSVAFNPFFLASAGGLLFSLTLRSHAGFMTNSVIDISFSFLELLSQAAIPLSLVAVGTAVIWKSLLKFDVLSLYLHVIKLFVLPALAFGASILFGISSVTAGAFIVFASLPTSASAHVLGSAYGARREPTALIVSQSTIFACLTLPFWMTVALSV